MGGKHSFVGFEWEEVGFWRYSDGAMKGVSVGNAGIALCFTVLVSVGVVCAMRVLIPVHWSLRHAYGAQQ